MEDRLLGIIMLGGKKNERPYSADDIQVFQTLANQMAVAIGHSLFLNDQKKSLNAETLGLIERLADGMAYQLRLRLNRCSVIAAMQQSSLQNFLSGCGDAVLRDSAQRKSLEYLLENSDALPVNLRQTENIIRNITFFARLASASDAFSTFYLKEEMERVLARLRDKHRLDTVPVVVRSAASDELWAMRPLFLESLFALLDNALDAIKEKTKVMKEEHKIFVKPEIAVTLAQGPGRTTIEVQDNGIGIRDEDRAMIFTPFFTTKQADGIAAGLGLAVARRVIEELHKGKIRFESVYGEGTTFSLELPRG
jgi:signal transduction histidine kinase